MSSAEILLVEDDMDIREGVRILLEGEGYHVSEAENGRAGLSMLTEATDLVILDIMMPGMSGLRTCEEIRKVSNVPVLFLTAKSRESDKLVGLMAGGDDYLAKPFSYAELLGRVKALLRRYCVYKGKENEAASGNGGYIELSGIRICRNYNEVSMNGRELSLSDIEYRILLLLMENPGRVFPAEELYETVWNEKYFYSCNSTITVHIRKLRVKIEKDPQKPKHVVTVWGRGYRFETRSPLSDA